MNTHAIKQKIDIDSILESASQLALDAIRQSKSPLFAYPGAHFYLTVDGDMLSNTKKQVARNDASNNPLEKIQQHLLAYPAPKAAGFHVLVMACNEDLTPHCAISYEPKLIRITVASLERRGFTPMACQFVNSTHGYIYQNL